MRLMEMEPRMEEGEGGGRGRRGKRQRRKEGGRERERGGGGAVPPPNCNPIRLKPFLERKVHMVWPFPIVFLLLLSTVDLPHHPLADFE